VIFWRFLAAKINYDEMDGDRLRLPANRNCYRLSRVSWALLKFLVLSATLWSPAIWASNCTAPVRIAYRYAYLWLHNTGPTLYNGKTTVRGSSS